MNQIASIADQPKTLSLQDYLLNPPDDMEWFDGQLLEKNGTTLKHGRVHSKLSSAWSNYKDCSALGGEVYIKPPCLTVQAVRRPDVAYLTPELLAQFGEPSVLPQSFPLIAEIISPTDIAEEVFSKVNEYLESGCQEVWLVLPESYWIVVITKAGRSLFTKGETASTQTILPGFKLPVDGLLS